MIIGITGRMHAGKTTAANLIISKSEATFHRHAFAEPLKAVCSAMTGCKISDLDDPKFKTTEVPTHVTKLFNSYFHLASKSYTYREFLQYFGTEMIRSHYQDFWVDVLMSKYDPNESNWIIDDLRFPNELESIRKFGGLVIKITRPNSGYSSHPSEMYVDKFKCDYLINNDGDLTDLDNKITTLNELIIKHLV